MESGQTSDDKDPRHKVIIGFPMMSLMEMVNKGPALNPMMSQFRPMMPTFTEPEPGTRPVAEKAPKEEPDMQELAPKLNQEKETMVIPIDMPSNNIATNEEVSSKMLQMKEPISKDLEPKPNKNKVPINSEKESKPKPIPVQLPALLPPRKPEPKIVQPSERLKGPGPGPTSQNKEKSVAKIESDRLPDMQPIPVKVNNNIRIPPEYKRPVQNVYQEGKPKKIPQNKVRWGKPYSRERPSAETNRYDSSVNIYKPQKKGAKPERKQPVKQNNQDYTRYKDRYEYNAPVAIKSGFCRHKDNGAYANPGLVTDVDPRCSYVVCSHERTFLFHCPQGTWNGLQYQHHRPIDENVDRAQPFHDPVEGYGTTRRRYYYYKYSTYGDDFCHLVGNDAYTYCGRSADRRRIWRY